MSGEQPDNTGPPQRSCEPFWLRSVLNKEPRERETHTHTVKTTACHSFAPQTPNRDSTSHTRSTFRSLEVRLSVRMLPLSRRWEINTARSALSHMQHVLQCLVNSQQNCEIQTIIIQRNGLTSWEMHLLSSSVRLQYLYVKCKVTAKQAVSRFLWKELAGRCFVPLQSQASGFPVHSVYAKLC